MVILSLLSYPVSSASTRSGADKSAVGATLSKRYINAGEAIDKFAAHKKNIPIPKKRRLAIDEGIRAESKKKNSSIKDAAVAKKARYNSRKNRSRR